MGPVEHDQPSVVESWLLLTLPSSPLQSSETAATVPLRQARCAVRQGLCTVDNRPWRFRFHFSPQETTGMVKNYDECLR